MGLSLGSAAIIAGIALSLMAVLAPIANFAILQNMIVAGDAAKTAGNILANAWQFKFGIFLFLLVAVLDIVVAWALYVFLAPINQSLSLLTAWLRIVYAAMLGSALTYLGQAWRLVSGAGLASLEASQRQGQVLLSLGDFNFGWELAMIVFGLHLLLLGILMFRAGYMKRILGSLLVLAALGYLIDGIGKLLSAGYHLQIAMFTFIGEIVLIFWLLIQGRRV